MSSDAERADAAIDAEGNPNAHRSQTDRLLALAADADLFHDGEGTAFALFAVSGHHETWPVHSKRFRQYLQNAFYHAEQRGARSQALQEAIETLAAKAVYQGAVQEVSLRVAEHGGCLYVDLCDEQWNVVELGAASWRIVNDPPVRFRRSPSMRSLPVTQAGKDLTCLRPFFRVTDDQFLLLVAWLTYALQPKGHKPVLELHGEQGSGKSTLTVALKRLVDPGVNERTDPRDMDALMSAATNNWCLAFSNLSHLQGWQSDALCRLSTGGAIAKRMLYTDGEEFLFDGIRPVVLNGINEVGTRSDLLDRTIAIELEPMTDDRRWTDATFWTSFDEWAPHILGAMLDLIASAREIAPTIKLPTTPRMSDYAVWGVAVERAMGLPAGAFLGAYGANRGEINSIALDASPLSSSILALVSQDGIEWQGKPSALLTKLGELAGEATKQQGWPKAANALTRDLKRLAPNLRAAGVEIVFPKRGSQARQVIVRKVTKTPSPNGVATDDARPLAMTVGPLLRGETVTGFEPDNDGNDGSHAISSAPACNICGAEAYATDERGQDVCQKHL